MDKDSFFVDSDHSTGYERLFFLRKITDLFFIPFLNSLPKSFSMLIKKSNESARMVIDNASNHRALEILYNHGFSSQKTGFLQKFFLKIWFNLHNSKAVRNRLKLVEKEIKKAISEIDKRDDDIRILSIASGSSRAIFESLSKVSDKNKFSITFLDKNPKALEYSKNLQKIILPLRSENQKYNWVEDKANNFVNYFSEQNSLDLIEMVGLLDYFTDEEVLKIFKNIYNYLQKGGVMITANITDNKERPFITKVVGWPMVYREPTKMIKLAEDAGFGRDKIRAIYEPFKIHIVIVAKK